MEKNLFGKVYSPNVQIEKRAASLSEPEGHREMKIQAPRPLDFTKCSEQFTGQGWPQLGAEHCPPQPRTAGAEPRRTLCWGA